MTAIAAPLIVYLPDTRGVEVSRYGRGNLKLGREVFTYSRPAGVPDGRALSDGGGTCPGATDECEAVCYAKRISGAVFDVYRRNTGSDVPPIPEEARLLRIHVSGDFDTPEYIRNWTARLRARPDVRAWAYTRSWRCHSLLEFLEELRALPNVQLFASMDASTKELPPTGWRRAWLQRDYEGSCSVCSMTRSNPQHRVTCPDTAGAHDYRARPVEDRLLRDPRGGDTGDNLRSTDGAAAYVCPEETGRKPDCVACGYCFRGRKHDVVFLEHVGPKVSR